MEQNVIGIDLGGTKISGALSDMNGNIIDKCIIPTCADKGEKVVLDRIIEVIDNLMKKTSKEKLKAIGIGSPGPLDAEKGVIITTPNLPFENFQLVVPIKEKYGVPVFLDNDANVAAIGEYMLGAGKGTKNMVYVTVSTGIGGGAIINERIYRGNTSNALEVGHMTLKKDGPRCNCGNYGCAEALASGTAIARIAKERVENGEETSLKKYEKITAQEVFKEAENGDKLSKEVLESSLNYLGICIANLITCFDPERVIIGGGVSKGGKIVFDTVKKVVKERCFRTLSEATEIIPAGLGTDAGVIGAVALALMEVRVN